MSILSALGYSFKTSKPNAEGLCKFKIIDENEQIIAEIDKPCTVEDALIAARKFIEKEGNNIFDAERGQKNVK